MDLQNLSNMEIILISAIIILLPTLYVLLPFEKLSRVIPIRLWIWTIAGTILAPIGQVLAIANLQPSQAEQTAAIIGSLWTSLWIITVTVTCRRVAGAIIDRAADAEKLEARLANIIKIALRYVITVLAALMVMEQWGFDPIAVITGLGVLSLGVALASQSAVSNIFGFANLLINKPFKEGDEITALGIIGKVVAINVGQTLVMQDDGDLVIIPNRHLSDAIVTNHSQKETLSLSTDVSFSPTTPLDKLDRLFTRVSALSFGGSFYSMECYYITSIGDRIVVRFHYQIRPETHIGDKDLAQSTLHKNIVIAAGELSIDLSGVTTEEVLICGRCDDCEDLCEECDPCEQCDTLPTEQAEDVIQPSTNESESAPVAEDKVKNDNSS